MRLSHPPADGSARPARRRLRRFALALVTAVAVAGGSAHAALADGVLLTLSATQAAPNTPVTMTATVTSSLILPTGTVTFANVAGGSPVALDGGANLVLNTVSSNSTSASFQTSTLAAGTYSIEAIYSPGPTAFMGGLMTNLLSPAQTLTITSSPPPTKYATQVTLAAPSGVVSTSPVDLTATVTRLNGVSGTPTGSVDFTDTISGSTIDLGPATLIGGVATLHLTNLAEGPHVIAAVYGGDSADTGSSSATQTVTSTAPVDTRLQTTSTVVATPTETASGDNVVFTATIVQQIPAGGSAPAPPGGTVTFTSDSTDCGNGVHLGSAALDSAPAGVTVAANQAAIQTSTLQPCTYTITASYSGDTFNQGSSGTLLYTVLPSRSGTNIAFTSATSAEYGHPATLSAVVTNQAHAPIVGKTVTFTLGSQSCSGTTDGSGAASCSFTVAQDVPGGTLAISVPQDLQVTGTTVNLNYTVTQEATALTVGYAPGPSTTTLSATLLTDTGAALANQPLSLSLGGGTCTARTDSTGAATCTVPTLTGQATAVLGASYGGATNYASATTSRTVPLVVATSLAYTGAATAVYGGSATLSAVLTAGSSPLAGRAVAFTLGTQNCSAQTDATGTATCTIAKVTKDPGTTSVTASYAGDSTSTGSSTSAPFTITRAPTSIALGTATVGATTTALSATLTTSGNALAGKTVTLALGAASCTAPTGANGVATCSVPTPSGASATFKATFAGDTDYTGSTASTTVTLLTPTSISYTGSHTADYQDPAVLSVSLRGPGDTPLRGRRVTIAMGSQSCTAVTDWLGFATCAIVVSQASGTYPITASFDGDSTYAPSTGTSTFVVTQEETRIVVDAPDNVTAGSTTTLTATLLADGYRPIAGRTVTLSLGSKSCTAVTNAAGVAACSVTAPSTTGRATVTATFAGDGYYAAASSSTTTSVCSPGPSYGGRHDDGDDHDGHDVGYGRGTSGGCSDR